VSRLFGTDSNWFKVEISILFIVVSLFQVYKPYEEVPSLPVQCQHPSKENCLMEIFGVIGHVPAKRIFEEYPA
jgi:hypothetical protein